MGLYLGKLLFSVSAYLSNFGSMLLPCDFTSNGFYRVMFFSPNLLIFLLVVMTEQ